MIGCANSSKFGGSRMHEVEWRPRAQLDRESIAIYLGLECKNPQAALSTIRMIDDAIRQVQAFPSMGRRGGLEDAAHHDYRRVLAGMYAAYYRFDTSSIASCIGARTSWITISST